MGLTLNADLEFISNGSRFAIAVERPELVADPALSGGGEILDFLGLPRGLFALSSGLEMVEVYAEASNLFFEPHAKYGVEDMAVLWPAAGKRGHGDDYGRASCPMTDQRPDFLDHAAAWFARLPDVNEDDP